MLCQRTPSADATAVRSINLNAEAAPSNASSDTSGRCSMFTCHPSLVALNLQTVNFESGFRLEFWVSTILSQAG